jgi:eukaryotic-like serine/threonine-protein kinase
MRQPIANASVSGNGVLLYDGTGPKNQLIWTDRRGHQLRPIGEPGLYGSPRLSADGRFVVTQTFEPGGSSELWTIDAERGLSSRLTSDPREKALPIWSPDGRTIAFTDTRDLLRTSATGDGRIESISPGANLRLADDWSRDGTTLLYTERFPDTRSDLITTEVTPTGKLKEGAQPLRYLSTPADEMHGRFSPEQKPHWIAYQSDESGRFEVYVDSYPERRGAVRVSTAGGTYPEWGPISGSRSELFYMSASGKLMAAELKIEQGRVEAAPPQELFALSPAEAGGGSSPFDVASGGQRFLVRTPVDSARPLTVVVNWTGLLKKAAN